MSRAFEITSTVVLNLSWNDHQRIPIDVKVPIKRKKTRNGGGNGAKEATPVPQFVEFPLDWMASEVRFGSILILPLAGSLKSGPIQVLEAATPTRRRIQTQPNTLLGKAPSLGQLLTETLCGLET